MALWGNKARKTVKIPAYCLSWTFLTRKLAMPSGQFTEKDAVKALPHAYGAIAASWNRRPRASTGRQLGLGQFFSLSQMISDGP